MNDKMELEEAVKVLQKTVKSNNEVIKEARKNGDINVMQLTADLDNQSIAIETILQELRNSIPKKRVKDKMKELKNKIKQNEKELKKNPDPINSKFRSFDSYFKWKIKLLMKIIY